MTYSLIDSETGTVYVGATEFLAQIEFAYRKLKPEVKRRLIVKVDGEDWFRPQRVWG